MQHQGAESIESPGDQSIQDMEQDSSAEITSVPVNKPEALENAQSIPTSFLHPNPYQLRLRPEDANLDDLVSSIQDVGLLEPLLVVRKGRKKYILIAGHRRLEAAKRAGLPVVPCLVLELSNDAFLRYSLIENLQRSDLLPLEEAMALKLLTEQLGLTYREIAAKVGKSAGYVSDRLALLELPDDLKDAIINGSLPLKKALELAKIPFERIRRKLLPKSALGDLEYFKQVVGEEIDHLKNRRKGREKWEILPELRDFAKSHDSIHIFKNRISVRYESAEDLRRLLVELTALLNDFEETE